MLAVGPPPLYNYTEPSSPPLSTLSLLYPLVLCIFLSLSMILAGDQVKYSSPFDSNEASSPCHYLAGGVFVHPNDDDDSGPATAG